jgi:uncharacterized protein YicC (UPF0701 family)
MTDLSETMISVPKRFAGFRSAASVLEDRSLSEAEKRTALLAWRAALRKAPPPASAREEHPADLIEEIDTALQTLRNRKAEEGSSR